MKQKIIVFLTLLSILMTGCSTSSNGVANVNETQEQNVFLTYEETKQITNDLTEAFEGFDVHVFVNNADTGVDFSLSMKCSIITAIYSDFVLWFSTNVLELAEKHSIPISKVDVTFFDTVTNELITWESVDGKIGRLSDFTENISVKESITPKEIVEIYGSAELKFPLKG